MTTIRRLLGIIVILTALFGVVLSVGCAVYGPDTLDSSAQQTISIIKLAQANISTTTEALELAQVTVDNVSVTLKTVEETADRLSSSIDDTQPLLTQINDITTQRLPDSLEAVEETLPNIAEVAGAVDDTLTTLSNFGFSQRFFGQTIDFSLGIEYDPESRFDESIDLMSESLAGLPEELRALETELETTETNLERVSSDIQTLSADISNINDNLDDLPPLLGEYVTSLNEVDGQLDDALNTIEGQLEMARNGILLLAIWFGLVQLAPFYVGWQMLTAPSTEAIKEDIQSDLLDEITEDEGEGALNRAPIVSESTGMVDEHATIVAEPTPPEIGGDRSSDPNQTIVDEPPTKE